MCWPVPQSLLLPLLPVPPPAPPNSGRFCSLPGFPRALYHGICTFKTVTPPLPLNLYQRTLWKTTLLDIWRPAGSLGSRRCWSDSKTLTQQLGGLVWWVAPPIFFLVTSPNLHGDLNEALSNCACLTFAALVSELLGWWQSSNFSSSGFHYPLHWHLELSIASGVIILS